MSTIITRLFHDRANAVHAVEELGRMGLRRSAVHVIEASAGAGALTALGITPTSAAKYASEAARVGGTLVVVEAAFGSAGPATAKLDFSGGVELGEDRYVQSLGRPTFSDALGLPTLSSDPAPLSRMLGMPTLTPGGGSSTKLLDNPAPFSSMLGLPVLSGGGSAPSTSLGLPTLTRSQGAPSTSLGLPTLTKSQSAPSTSLGLPTLSKSSD
jgi:hypothetical protein